MPDDRDPRANQSQDKTSRDRELEAFEPWPDSFLISDLERLC